MSDSYREWRVLPINRDKLCVLNIKIEKITDEKTTDSRLCFRNQLGSVQYDWRHLHRAFYKGKRTLQNKLGDKLIFIGPDVWEEKRISTLRRIDELLADWRKHFNGNIRSENPRWQMENTRKSGDGFGWFPTSFLQKNTIYSYVWEKYGVDSLHAYENYDESSMFGYATGMVMESCFRYNLTKETL